MSFETSLYVVLGGAIGTFARYAISVLELPLNRQLPWGTIVVNVTGCAIIGFVGTLTLSDGRFPISENLRLLLMVGFCGGYTTFSAFSLQTFELLRAGAMLRAGVNIGLSIILCLAAVAFGHIMGARLNEGAAKIAQTQIEEDA